MLLVHTTMITRRNIGKVLSLVEEHNKQYTVPAVTLVARNHHSPFHVLITTIISLRTKDEVTWKAAERLFKKAYTPKEMLKVSEQEIQKLIFPTGFYKTKATTIKDLCRILLEKYDGVVPDTIEELITLKGVGRKTANLVLIEGYQKPAMCIDTHCHRIPNRWGLIKTKSPEQTEFTLRDLLPQKYWKKFNELLVTFGQNQCTPVSPKCSTCPLNELCPKIGVTVHR